MRNNDLSNRGLTQTVGIRVEDTLFNFKNEGIINKAYNLVSPYYKADIDKGTLNLITYLYRYTDIKVDLYVDKDYLDKKLLDRLNDVPYSDIIPISDINDIRNSIADGNISYYIDNSIIRQQEIKPMFTNIKYPSYNVSEFSNLIKFGGDKIVTKKE